jgi:hypothetical protein
VRRAGLGAAIVAAFFVWGCSESPQVTVYKQGKYQGKPDTPAWGSGDRASWETALKARQLTQNEYKRIYER